MVNTPQNSVPKNSDNCSICNLERKVIAKADSLKSFNIRRKKNLCAPFLDLVVSNLLIVYTLLYLFYVYLLH